VRSTSVDAGGTRFAPMGEGRDCLGGAADSLVEEIYMLRDMQPALTKKGTARISDAIRLRNSRTSGSRYAPRVSLRRAARSRFFARVSLREDAAN